MVTIMCNNLSELYVAATENGGGTLWLKEILSPTTGYVVALARTEMRVNINAFTPELLMFYAETILAPGSDGLGVWYDEENGHIYLDSVLRFFNKAVALSKAACENQLAIYDLGTETVINL